MPDYRSIARARLEKATRLLATNDSDDLTYACLELRKCIEALSYDLLQAYLKEVPLRALETWQADKVMKELRAIDPTVHSTSRIRMREEGRDGSPDGPWKVVGEDRRLNQQFAAKSYHQLGGFLHVPTIKQAQTEQSSPPSATIRARAEKIREQLAHVLAARIWNANFATRYTFNCAECEAPISRRVSVIEAGGEVECGNCGQPYDVEREADGKMLFIPRSFSWECAVCGVRREIAQRLAKDGLDVSCPECSDPTILRAKKGWILERPNEKQENLDQ
jgi:DNA-directed RNA polymerase subunit RPC12/RpoP